MRAPGGRAGQDGRVGSAPTVVASPEAWVPRVLRAGDQHQLHVRPAPCSCRTLGGSRARRPGVWAAVVLRSCGLRGAIASAFSHVSSTAGGLAFGAGKTGVSSARLPVFYACSSWVRGARLAQPGRDSSFMAAAAPEERGRARACGLAGWTRSLLKLHRFTFRIGPAIPRHRFPQMGVTGVLPHVCSHRGTQRAQRRVALGWHVRICLWTNIGFCKMRGSERL